MQLRGSQGCLGGDVSGDGPVHSAVHCAASDTVVRALRVLCVPSCVLAVGLLMPSDPNPNVAEIVRRAFGETARLLSASGGGFGFPRSRQKRLLQGTLVLCLRYGT